MPSGLAVCLLFVDLLNLVCRTPLHYAVMCANGIDCVRTLLDHSYAFVDLVVVVCCFLTINNSADVDARDGEGWSPLLRAALVGFVMRNRFVCLFSLFYERRFRVHSRQEIVALLRPQEALVAAVECILIFYFF